MHSADTHYYNAMGHSKPSAAMTEAKQVPAQQYTQKGMLVYETKDRAACSSVKPTSQERKKRNEAEIVISTTSNAHQEEQRFNNTLGSPTNNWFPNINNPTVRNP